MLCRFGQFFMEKKRKKQKPISHHLDANTSCIIWIRNYVSHMSIAFHHSYCLDWSRCWCNLSNHEQHLGCVHKNKRETHNKRGTTPSKFKSPRCIVRGCYVHYVVSPYAENSLIPTNTSETNISSHQPCNSLVGP